MRTGLHVQSSEPMDQGEEAPECTVIWNDGKQLSIQENGSKDSIGESN